MSGILGSYILNLEKYGACWECHPQGEYWDDFQRIRAFHSRSVVFFGRGGGCVFNDQEGNLEAWLVRSVCCFGSINSQDDKTS